MANKTNCKINLQYKLDSKLFNIQLKNGSCDENILCEIIEKENTLKVLITPKKQVSLIKADLSFEKQLNRSDKVFVNGYQSWTDNKEFSYYEKLKSLNFVPDFIINKYQLDRSGDYLFKKYSNKRGVFHGYTYSYIRTGDEFELLGSLSEYSGYTIFNFDFNSDKVLIEKDVEGVSTNITYELFNLFSMRGDDKTVFDEYFKEMNVKCLANEPKTGYTSWYNHYQNISEEIILDNIKSVASFEVKPDIFQIDDGYQTAVGDWLSVDKTKFKNSMKVIADNITDNGLIPGLWLAPFACEYKSEIVKNHSDWILKDELGQLVKGGGNWGGFYSLDFYNDEVREYIKNCFDTIINDWGFEMVKLDFLYAVSINPAHGKSRATIMCEAMDFLRECVGDKLILGCGVPLGPAFGKVDFCRIGCDVSLDFNGPFIERRLHRERVSTKNTMYSSIYRRQLDGRAFLNDPDVFLLRDNNISLSEQQKENLWKVNSLFGSLLFTSDNIGDYTDKKKQALLDAFHNKNAKVIKVDEEKGNVINVVYTLDNEVKNITLTLK